MKAGGEGLADRACPLCGARDESAVFAPAALDSGKLDAYAFASRKTPEYMHYRLIECRADDLLYASPAPAAADLAAEYEKAAYDSGAEAGFAARAYARLLPEIEGRLPDRAGALDVGAGDGAFLAELLARGFSGVEGVEPSRAPVAAARADVRPLIRRGVFSPEDFAPGAYSLFTSFQTLEHVDDPLGLCRGAYRLLKEGGAILVVCHDRRALSARLLGLKSPIFDVEHLQLFSERSVRALLERAGFADIRVQTIRNRYPLRYWLRLLPLPSLLKRAVLALADATGLGALPVALPAGNLAAVGFKSP